MPRNDNLPGLLPAIVDLDGARVLPSLVGSNPESARCAAIDLEVANGVAAANVAPVETDRGVPTIDGQVAPESEAMDLKLTQVPKKTSLLSGHGPSLSQSTLLSPDTAPSPEPLAVRTAAAALPGLVTP